MTTTKMIAINSIQICNGVESEISGYREDGSPITKLIRHIFEPGELFDCPESDVARFIDMGAATTDLNWLPPKAIGGGQ